MVQCTLLFSLWLFGCVQMDVWLAKKDKEEVVVKQVFDSFFVPLGCVTVEEKDDGFMLFGQGSHKMFATIAEDLLDHGTRLADFT